jgi:hypothetical protein
MQLKNEPQTGLAAELRLIPMWAWIIAAILLLVAETFFLIFVPMQSDSPPPVWARPLLGAMAGAVVGGYVLLIGYISRDTRRRGMSPLLWILIAILIPNGLGFILYFILRQPRIGAAVAAAVVGGTRAFDECPNCHFKLNPSCPKCQHAVGFSDSYCAACGTALKPASGSVAMA